MKTTAGSAWLEALRKVAESACAWLCWPGVAVSRICSRRAGGGSLPRCACAAPRSPPQAARTSNPMANALFPRFRGMRFSLVWTCAFCIVERRRARRRPDGIAREKALRVEDLPAVLRHFGALLGGGAGAGEEDCGEGRGRGVVVAELDSAIDLVAAGGFGVLGGWHD